jgi:hypothetical protein
MVRGKAATTKTEKKTVEEKMRSASAGTEWFPCPSCGATRRTYKNGDELLFMEHRYYDSTLPDRNLPLTGTGFAHSTICVGTMRTCRGSNHPPIAAAPDVEFSEAAAEVA